MCEKVTLAEYWYAYSGTACGEPNIALELRSAAEACPSKHGLLAD